ncbi:exodeoxyribonuclease III [Pseudoclavibacter soli]|uniref:exodeoxyribonuclease III n=1 Tax=Pseudoclavibacter soli TaxID=452623 RepID=UPI000480A761|nr:exodeoxyribonuclease III [Pseudoclavibacter soli]
MRLATINVNGVRAAFRKGIDAWLAASRPDVLALQEVRAADADLASLLPGWTIAHDACSQKGRAGVAVAIAPDSDIEIAGTRTAIGDDDFDSSGRWLETDLRVGDETVTVVSAYAHSGEVDTPKQVEKYRMLEAMSVRLDELGDEHELAVVVGDLNVCHTPIDIRNWRSNLKRAGFLPDERAYFDQFFGDPEHSYTRVDGTDLGTGLGWIDLGRAAAGDVPGPYTWWSWRGQAFDNDAGWRIDYQAATAALAARALAYFVDRPAAYDARFTDHSPVVVDYARRATS